jgi:hypothetical protein
MRGRGYCRGRPLLTVSQQMMKSATVSVGDTADVEISVVGRD